MATRRAKSQPITEDSSVSLKLVLWALGVILGGLWLTLLNMQSEMRAGFSGTHARIDGLEARVQLLERR